MVQLYSSDDELITTLVTYLADAVFAGGLAVAVATPEHRAAIAEHLATTAQVPPALGTVVLIDARELLDQFMVDGRPDRDRFETTVGALVRSAAATVAAGPERVPAELAAPRPIHAFGEMVALLWEDGLVAAALELEELWNGLRERYEFSLFCGYPSSLVSKPEAATALHEVCRLHGVVLEPTGPAPRPAARPTPTPAAAAVLPHGHAHRRPPHRHRPAAATSYCVRCDFLPERGAPRGARRFVADVLARSGGGDLADDAGLVVTELATNAVLHACSPFSVTVSVEDDVVRLAVRDRSRRHPRPSEARAMAAPSSGRGLGLVAALSRSWGVDEVPGGKVVWAELARRSGRRKNWRTNVAGEGVRPAARGSGSSTAESPY